MDAKTRNKILELAYYDSAWIRDYILQEQSLGLVPCWDNFRASGQLNDTIEVIQADLAGDDILATYDDIYTVLAYTFEDFIAELTEPNDQSYDIFGRLLTPDDLS